MSIRMLQRSWKAVRRIRLFRRWGKKPDQAKVEPLAAAEPLSTAESPALAGPQTTAAVRGG